MGGAFDCPSHSKSVKKITQIFSKEFAHICKTILGNLMSGMSDIFFSCPCPRHVSSLFKTCPSHLNCLTFYLLSKPLLNYILLY